MRLEIVDANRCVGCQSCMFACTRKEGKAGIAESCIHVKSVGGMGRGFSVIVCRACPDPPCAGVCPTEALVARKGGGVKLDPAKCIACGNCREACLIGAVFADASSGKPLICIHCGYCARHCPHGVLWLSREEAEAAGATTETPHKQWSKPIEEHP